MVTKAVVGGPQQEFLPDSLLLPLPLPLPVSVLGLQANLKETSVVR